MTAYELQLALGNEVERISKDILLKDVKGYPAHIKAFAQSLPKRFQDVADMKMMRVTLCRKQGRMKILIPIVWCG